MKTIRMEEVKLFNLQLDHKTLNMKHSQTGTEFAFVRIFRIEN